MKGTLGLAVILAVTATAAADIRVFVTTSSAGYGLNEPQNAFIPTFSTVDVMGNNVNAYDYYNSVGNFNATGNGDATHGFSVTNYPPLDAPSGTAASPVQIAAGDWAYIWFQFRNEPRGSKLNGLVVEITDVANHSAHLTPTWYLQNDLGGEESRKRWDGTATAPDYPEWHNNPQTMVSITAGGIFNGSDNPQMMFDSQSGTNPRTGVALLGALPVSPNRTYTIAISNWGYSSPPYPTVAPAAVFQSVPEPATILLLSLAGLLIRRR